MTDTTDKERDLKVAVDSLKHSCLRLNKYQHRATVDIEDVELVLTELEAERQRADKSDAMLSECLESLKAAEKELGIRSHQLVKADASVADLEKRLRYTEEALIAATDLHVAALKGDQVPVGFAVMDENHDWHIDFCGKEHALSHGDSLFTAPQNPVVLPSLTIGEVMHRSGFDREYAEGWVSANDNAIREIKAAGGIVKDGE